MPILCRFKILSVVLCVTLWYSNFSIYLKLKHIVTYGNILKYPKLFLAGHLKGFRIRSGAFFLCTFWTHLPVSPGSGNLLRIHKNAPIRGQMPPAGTIRPHQAPSAWTKVISRTKLPQKAPPVWTGGNYFSSASTKDTRFVDKTLLLICAGFIIILYFCKDY